jgi:uncharacterized membrane protein
MEVAMWRDLTVFLLLPPFMFLLDYLWLGLAASRIYKKDLATFLRLSGGDLDPVLWAAVVVYIAIPLGIVLFVLPRVSPESPIGSGLLWGMAYGLVVYTIYEMTNYSLLKGWPLRLAFVDIAWGAFLNGTATAFAAAIRGRMS